MKNKIVILIILILIASIVGVYKMRIKKSNNELNKSNNAVILSDKYKNPIVPEGFHVVETESASWEEDENGNVKGWNNGLVIEDEDGNQFVWVPYDSKTNSIKLDEDLVKNGGFYISRYEAGVSKEMSNMNENISEDTNNISDIPVSKKNARPWNFISWEIAKENATKMYNTNNIESDLLTIEQMKLVDEWLNNAGFNINDSTEWGNYSNNSIKVSGLVSSDNGKNWKNSEGRFSNNIIIATGISEESISNNIYDWAGNLWEYTNTKYENTEYYYSHGGYFGTYGGNNPASSVNAFTNEPSSKVGFRVVLNFK